MYNIKHMTILLVAVFFALGIGIAIGFTANSDKLLVKQQKIIIDQLEENYTHLKESSRMKERQLALLIESQKRDYEFLAQNFDMLLAGRLQGKKASVIEFGNSDKSGEIIDCLKKAGAQVQFITIVNEEVKGSDLDVFAEAFATGNIEKFQYLKEAGLIEFIGVYDRSVDFIVLIRNGEKNNPLSTVKKLVRLKPVVIVQSSNLPKLDVKDSDRLFYIDNIDTVMGKYRMIISLTNNF
ncbi:copper transporter [Thermosediminibacter litoriperuensis]|uniref:Copper transport outer membrane protein MctB n=1 Tax=Thermosediminibacter litoriperuensis TaxID=291989 RepID=A0A5S5ARC8_9FIRM|nr:copper transporter [Thermosediminibacter litoriperuensis]TYP54254.1 copper transport outer membrane protein MctB [Thermosediminibacter litoriperuensis]